MDQRMRVGVFGATGSIGKSTLDVLARHPQRFEVHTLTARQDDEQLFQLIKRFSPAVVGLTDQASAQRLQAALTKLKLNLRPEVVSGQAAVDALAASTELDVVVAAIVGLAGLGSTAAALQSGKRVLLANKESIVAAGSLMLSLAEDNNATLLPIDSEHNAIFQCLPSEHPSQQAGVDSLLLTASGGPFRDWSKEQMAAATPAQACAHPNWSMGPKISVDSATMMNKGLEVIEAARLFAMRADQIEVVIHPQSIIHSMVRFVDGSVLAQMGEPDMRTPIAHALAWPERIESGVRALDFFTLANLEFQRPDLARFPCLELAFEALKAGGAAPLVLNAANEIAVSRFLRGELAFNTIPELIKAQLDSALSGTSSDELASIESIIALDERVRQSAMAWSG